MSKKKNSKKSETVSEPAARPEIILGAEASESTIGELSDFELDAVSAEAPAFTPTPNDNAEALAAAEAAANAYAPDPEFDPNASSEALELSEGEDAPSEVTLEAGEREIAADLDEAANAWESDISAGSAKSSGVSFLADPYGIRSLEISEAQRNDEYMIEDDLDDDSTAAAEHADAEAAETLSPEELAVPTALSATTAEDDASGDASDGEVFDEDDSDAPELVLDTDEAALSDTLKNLEARMQAQEADLTAEAAVNAANAEAEAKVFLDAQIAEDQALEKAMKEDAERDAELDPELLSALPKMPSHNDETGELDLSELQSAIEALLFMVEKPLSAAKLHELLGPDMSLNFFQEALTEMKDRYQKLHHGFELVEVGGGYQFRTKPIRAALARKLSKVQTQRLSTGAMETLAICAYQQPIMKEDVDKIRGVDSSHFIRGLMDKKLIKISGRSELPGRPMLYTTTHEFLELFGLKSLDDLPPLKEVASMIPSSQSGLGDEDPRVRQMRELVGEMKADTSVSLLYDPKEDERFLTEIREKVQGIAVTTPTLAAQVEAQKAREKAIKEGTLDAQSEANEEAMQSVNPGETPDLPLNS